MTDNLLPTDHIIAVVGPTASGKTHRAVQLAHKFGAEIISADSRQIYKGMDIGTGKDLSEYGTIPYHLIDVCNAGEKYNLHRFLTDARLAIRQINEHGNRVVVCGGTGMYIENLLAGVVLPNVPMNNELRENLKRYSLFELTEILKKYKQLHNSTDVDSCQRAIRAIEIEEWYKTHPEDAILSARDKRRSLKSTVIGINIPREARRERISMRLRQRIDEGMIGEAKRLLSEGVTHDDLQYYGLEYKFLSLHLQGILSLNEMIEKLEIAIHQFAKRQMTWLRGMERRGIHINWISYDLSDNDFIRQVLTHINSNVK